MSAAAATVVLGVIAAAVIIALNAAAIAVLWPRTSDEDGERLAEQPWDGAP